MKPRDVVVATHGHCFDGMASATAFTALLRALEPGIERTFRYRSCGYGPNMQQVPAAWLDGDDNAILDFRFTATDKLAWYFDHHVTAFGSAEELEAARARASEGKLRLFFEPTYGSCTRLIADVARDRFSIDLASLGELVRWADVIDAARFSSAAEATNRDEPALMLAAVVEHHGDGPFLNAIVPELLERSLVEVCASDRVQDLARPLRAAQEAFSSRIQATAKVVGRVVSIDLAEAKMEAGAKFVTYAMFPACVYSVMLARVKQHYKLSVGYNPWCGVARDRDIASICKRYDGGGHPAVGACSFPLSDLARARKALTDVTAELAA